MLPGPPLQNIRVITDAWSVSLQYSVWHVQLFGQKRIWPFAISKASSTSIPSLRCTPVPGAAVDQHRLRVPPGSPRGSIAPARDECGAASACSQGGRPVIGTPIHSPNGASDQADPICVEDPSIKRELRRGPYLICRVSNAIPRRLLGFFVKRCEQLVPERATAEVQIPMLFVDGMTQLMRARRLHKPSPDPPVSPRRLAVRQKIGPSQSGPSGSTDDLPGWHR